MYCHDKYLTWCFAPIQLIKDDQIWDCQSAAEQALLYSASRASVHGEWAGPMRAERGRTYKQQNSGHSQSGRKAAIGAENKVRAGNSSIDVDSGFYEETSHLL